MPLPFFPCPFPQAVPELQSSGFNPHPALAAVTSFLPFDPNVFLRDCQVCVRGGGGGGGGSINGAMSSVRGG